MAASAIRDDSVQANALQDLDELDRLQPRKLSAHDVSRRAEADSAQGLDDVEERSTGLHYAHNLSGWLALLHVSKYLNLQLTELTVFTTHQGHLRGNSHADHHDKFSPSRIAECCRSVGSPFDILLADFLTPARTGSNFCES